MATASIPGWQRYLSGKESGWSETRSLARYAWGVLAYNVLVIVWGAFVRATGSGAGCGSHWPLCNGEVVPRSRPIETVIELTHRLTSGVALILVVALVWRVFRTFPKKHAARKGAIFSLVFILMEALIGAGLVLFELVAHNASLKRAVSLSAHMVNTFLLLGALTVTAWLVSGGAAWALKRWNKLAFLFMLGTLGMMLLGVSGALAALGDTLFPVKSLAEGIRQDFATEIHFLIRLRLWHPFIAIGVGFLAVAIANYASFVHKSPIVRRWGRITIGIVIAQLVLGTLNVVLLAPTWMQLVHLFLADGLWIAYVLLATSACSQPEPARETSTEANPQALRALVAER